MMYLFQFPQHVSNIFAMFEIAFPQCYAMSHWQLSQSASFTDNHHYVAHMTGAGAKFNKVVLDGPDDPLAKKLMKMSGHGMIALDQPHYVVEELRNASIKGASTNTVVSSANGGVCRFNAHCRHVLFTRLEFDTKAVHLL